MDICLRQGYQCKCSQCQIWIDRWNKELETFLKIDAMMNEGKSIFSIYEFLRGYHPDILVLHHRYIENLYMQHLEAIKTKEELFDKILPSQTSKEEAKNLDKI